NDHLRPRVRPTLVADGVDPPADPPRHPPVASGGAQRLVPLDHLVGDGDHLLGLEPAVDAQITQRPEEALDVRFHAEGLPVEGAGHVEAPVAAVEAPIAEGDYDVSLGHELPVEPGGPGGHGRGPPLVDGWS